ncbi:hypothetical protein V8E52_010828 [Russula decolorans]
MAAIENVEISSGDDMDDANEQPIRSKKKHGSLGNPVAVDEEGLLLDVNVQLADKDPPMREDKWRDVNQFFHAPVEKEIGGKKKKQCICKLCP